MDLDEATIRIRRDRPTYYHRDGTPIVSDDPAIPDCLAWAKEFEHQDRKVAATMTLYDERLSTVFLGMDHGYSLTGPPIIFETMLFAPESADLRAKKRERLRTWMVTLNKEQAIEETETYAEEEYIEKHYPHDQLQQRYATEAQAIAGHRRLQLQCLIPPRWRRFLLYKIGKDELWQ